MLTLLFTNDRHKFMGKYKIYNLTFAYCIQLEINNFVVSFCKIPKVLMALDQLYNVVE